MSYSIIRPPHASPAPLLATDYFYSVHRTRVAPPGAHLPHLGGAPLRHHLLQPRGQLLATVLGLLRRRRLCKPSNLVRVRFKVRVRVSRLCKPSNLRGGREWLTLTPTLTLTLTLTLILTLTQPSTACLTMPWPKL